MDNFEVKKHYKMYKAGKNWVVAPLITVGVVTGIAMGTSLSMADEVSVNNENANVVQSEKSLNFDNNSISNEDETLKNNDDNDNKEVEKTDETKDVNNDENITNETVAQNDTSAERAVIDNVTDKVTGEQKIDDHWYLFNDRGEMQQGLQDLRPYGSEKHAYYNEAGQMQYGWQRVNNEAHYFDTYGLSVKRRSMIIGIFSIKMEICNVASKIYAHTDLRSMHITMKMAGCNTVGNG
ncbi:MAG: KxYKxGKxW signal peptide domain-containing protein [Ligilactobacillus animalis]|nr:KxYKxGKxW signal peptide domain-containing protein [Ligilactobacillus animalis]